MVLRLLLSTGIIQYVAGRTHFLHRPPKTLGWLAFLTGMTSMAFTCTIHAIVKFQYLNCHLSSHLVPLYAGVPSSSPCFFHSTTQHYIMHLSCAFTSSLLLLSLVACIGVLSSGWGHWLFVVYVLTPEIARHQLCGFLYQPYRSGEFSERCLSIKKHVLLDVMLWHSI